MNLKWERSTGGRWKCHNANLTFLGRKFKVEETVGGYRRTLGDLKEAKAGKDPEGAGWFGGVSHSEAAERRRGVS